jgi:hypothetical protein
MQMTIDEIFGTPSEQMKLLVDLMRSAYPLEGDEITNKVEALA